MTIPLARGFLPERTTFSEEEFIVNSKQEPGKS
jgi:hypothetical protein